MVAVNSVGGGIGKLRKVGITNEQMVATAITCQVMTVRRFLRATTVRLYIRPEKNSGYDSGTWMRHREEAVMVLCHHACFGDFGETELVSRHLKKSPIKTSSTGR